MSSVAVKTLALLVTTESEITAFSLSSFTVPFPVTEIVLGTFFSALKLQEVNAKRTETANAKIYFIFFLRNLSYIEIKFF